MTCSNASFKGLDWWSQPPAPLAPKNMTKGFEPVASILKHVAG